MNKKIMSFVLAMVLSVGLGVSSAFAYSYDKYAQEFNSSFLSGSGNSNLTTVNVGKPTDLLGGNLTTVFNYYAGTLLSYHSSGGQFVLNDSYGPRFGVDNKGGAWNVNSVNLRTSDLAAMEQAGSAEEFLKGMGFTEQQLKVVAMNADGEILDTEGNPISASDSSVQTGSSQISDAWFTKLKDTIKSGVNYSASVSMGNGMTGPSLTVSENGKPMAVYQTDPAKGDVMMTTLYRYDNNAMLCGIETKTFEMQATESGTATLNATINYTKIAYNSDGTKTETVYKFANFSSDPEGTIANAPIATPDKKDLTGDEAAMVMSQTTYSANNSALNSIDYTKNITTYYANNQPSYGVNEVGVTVELYKYTANGVIQAHFNANGTDNNGDKVGTTTIYDKWGRQLFTAVTGSPDKVFNNQAATNDLINEYNRGIREGKFTVAQFDEEGKPISGTGTTITNVNIYADQILDTSKELIMSNGFIDMKKVNRYLNSSDVGSFLKNNLAGFGYSTNDILNMLRFSNGTNTALAQTTIVHSSWDSESLPEGADTSGATQENTTATVGTVSKSAGTHRWHQIVGTEEANDGRTTYNGIQYTNTILLGGAQAYSNTHCVVSEIISITNVNAIYETDPAVEGSLWSPEVSEEELAAAIKENGIDPNDEEAVSALKEELLDAKIIAKAKELGIDVNNEDAMNDLKNGFYTDANGQTYAIINASSINIMDGSGFQPADGEIVLVAVSNSVKQNVIDTIKRTGDRSVMFMGDVRESTTGHLTMTMNTNYGGGIVQGSKEVQEAKTEIANESMKVAYAKYLYENSNKTEEDYEKYQQVVKDAGWVGENTDANIEKLAKGDFSWDPEKTAIENLRAAWSILLNF